MSGERAPPWPALLAEGRIAAEWAASRLAWRRIARAHAGEGRERPVLVIPGFLADDPLTVTLRRTLAAAGWRAHGWGLGRNRGISPELLERMVARLEAVAADAPAALVGWSLGGLYARELAKRRPGLVTRVVTLGSPFSGDPRANHAWRACEAVTAVPSIAFRWRWCWRRSRRCQPSRSGAAATASSRPQPLAATPTSATARWRCAPATWGW